MLTLLTATGCRPKAWGLCQRWMMAQDYSEPVRWIVVDDGEEKQLVDFNREGWTLDLVWPSHVWQPGMNTQAQNIAAGLELVADTDRLVIIEDDDHYAPDWLTHVSKMLQKAELVGECRARYYNVEKRIGRQLANTQHASLCSSAMTGVAIKHLRDACQPGVKFIDMTVWRGTATKYLFDGHRVTGIKGLPGRGGIGMGHKGAFAGNKDKSGGLLRSWIGADAEAYL